MSLRLENWNKKTNDAEAVRTEDPQRSEAVQIEDKKQGVVNQLKSSQEDNVKAKYITAERNWEMTSNKWTLLNYQCIRHLWAKINGYLDTIFPWTQGQRDDACKLTFKIQGELRLISNDALKCLHIEKNTPRGHTQEADAFDKLHNTWNVDDYVSWRKAYISSTSRLYWLLNYVIHSTTVLYNSHHLKQSTYFQEETYHRVENAAYKLGMIRLSKLTELARAYRTEVHATMCKLDSLDFLEDLSTQRAAH
jgi:hypothetical protein